MPCAIINTIIFSALCFKQELRFTMQQHDHPISIQTSDSRGNNELITDVKINISRDPLKTKSKTFLKVKKLNLPCELIAQSAENYSFTFQLTFFNWSVIRPQFLCFHQIHCIYIYIYILFCFSSSYIFRLFGCLIYWFECQTVAPKKHFSSFLFSVVF